MSSESGSKYLHTFPILDPSMSTTDLIAAAYALLPRVGPKGYALTRCEWHRSGLELTLLCDLVPCPAAWGRCRAGDRNPSEDQDTRPRWVKVGLIWEAA